MIIRLLLVLSPVAISRKSTNLKEKKNKTKKNSSVATSVGGGTCVWGLFSTYLFTDPCAPNVSITLDGGGGGEGE